MDASVRWLSGRVPVLRAAIAAPALPPVVNFSPTLPQNIAYLPTGLAHFFREKLDFPGTRFFTLRRVTVSWHATIFRNFSLFLPALAEPTWRKFYDDSYLLKQWLGKSASVPAGPPLALVHDQWTRANYYHWLVDALPRLLVLRDHCPSARLIMPLPIPAHVAQTAQLLGFTHLVPLAEAEIVKANILLVPERVAPLGYQNPNLLRRLRAEITTKLFPKASLGSPTRRIYVSRSRQQIRRLANEAAVLAVLERHQFECVYFEEMSFAEQVALMQQTVVLLGVHGANLANLVFLPAGSQVVELMNEDKFLKLGNANFENLIYYRMSAILELPYFAVPCQTAPEQPPTNDADIVADVGAITRLMEQFFAN